MKLSLRVCLALLCAFLLTLASGCGSSDLSQPGSGENVAPPSNVEKD